VHTRRRFLQTTGAGLLGLPSLLQAQPGSDTFRFGVIADSHVIDGFYRGPESNPEDSESIFLTSERLTAARDVLNAVDPGLDLVFLVGDYFHDYPSPDLAFYFDRETRVDRAKAITDGFHAPVHAGFGNHDYAVPLVSRETSHELFRRKFGLKPYYSIDHRGWRFIHVNNFLGSTWEAGHADYNRAIGSLGEQQLLWLEAQLAERQPSFVFVHYPLSVVKPAEVLDLGLHSLLKRHADTVQRVISGHWHRWVDAGTQFGPPHLVMGATRYDPDAYLIVEVDTRRSEHRLLNIDLVEWNTHFSQPYLPGHLPGPR
jgi:hypothetical protein